MNESIRKYMKVGLIHFMVYPAVIKGDGPIEETFRKIALDDYFEVAEITAEFGNFGLMVDLSHLLLLRETSA